MCYRNPLILLAVLFSFSFIGCYSTSRGYSRMPPGSSESPFSSDARHVRVVLVRSKDCKELGLSRDEALIAIDPALGEHGVLLVAGKGLAPQSKWGMFPSLEVSTSNQSLRGWLLELTDKSSLNCLDEIVPEGLREPKDRQKVGEKTLRTIWTRWWKIVADGKADEYGVRVSPVTGSLRTQGMESRYKSFSLNLETTTDGRHQEIRSEIEYFELNTPWMN